MPGPWYDVGDLLEDIAGAMQLDDVTQLAPRWTNTANRALIDAANDITEFLGGMGYVGSQIDAWDANASANSRLALRIALMRGAPEREWPTKYIEELDPRPAIKDQGTIMIGGIPTGVTPGASDVGGIASGTNAVQAALAANYRGRFGEPFPGGGCWPGGWVGS